MADHSATAVSLLELSQIVIAVQAIYTCMSMLSFVVNVEHVFGDCQTSHSAGRTKTLAAAVEHCSTIVWGQRRQECVLP
jgi:hypothetical protein